MSEVITQGFGATPTTAEGGAGDMVIQEQVLPVLEKLEDAVEYAMNELSARGLGFRAAYARLIGTVDNILRKHPEYYLLNLEKMSPEMKMSIGLREGK